MPDNFFWVILLGVAVVAIIVHAVRWKMDQKRTAILRSVAHSMGMEFEEKGMGLLDDPFTNLPLFSRGRAGKMSNVMRGEDEVVFGYTYRTGSGRSQKTHRQTVAALRDPGSPVPRFELKPEVLWDKLAEKFGGQDIDFDDDTEFSRMYRLRGTDEMAIRDLFYPSVRQVLTQDFSWSVEGEGDWVLAFRHNERVEPDGISKFLDDARYIAIAVRSGIRT